MDNTRSLKEKLPFHDKKSDLVITADARIDNRKELSKDLMIEDGEDISDSYYILKSYEKWGERCTEYLLGDFSFVIWNKKNEKIFCARDHMGVKPFYYYINKNMFVFGTEIKAINFIKEIPSQLNETRLADYLIQFVEDRENTFYKDIQRLPAAHSLNISKTESIKNNYWKLDPNKEILLGSDEEYAKEFLKIFTNAIKCRIRSAYPVGSFLSGGLDSSSIVCTARKIMVDEDSTDNLKTFSAVYDDLPICDETEYINEVLALGNLDPYLLKTNQYSPLHQIESILKKIEEPFNVPNYYINPEIFQTAKKNNVRILLDGFDGDTTLLFEERYALDITRENQWKKLFSELNFMAKKYNLNTLQMFLYAIIIPITPEIIQKLIFQRILIFWVIVNLIENENFNLIKKDFLQCTNFKTRFKYLFKNPLKNAKTNKLRHHLRLSSPYLQYALEILDIFASNS